MLERMMRQRLLAQETFEDAISTVLNDVVALQGAEFGDVQLPVGDELWIVAQRGLAATFLQAFMRVRGDDDCACGRALRERKTVVIPDVEEDLGYAEFRADARAAGYRGVQSTPLFTSDGQFVGIVSTLFANVHEPTPIERETLKKYSVVAADYLRQLLGDEALASKTKQMNARLHAQFGLHPSSESQSERELASQDAASASLRA